MFWLSSILATSFAIVAIGVLAQLAWLRRHLRYPFAFVASVLGISVVAIPVSVWLTLNEIATSDPTAQFAIAAQFLLLVLVVVLFTWLRHAPISASTKRRILVVGAHPDDLELACGGSLARFADEGHQVLAIVMSHGSGGGDGATREQEAIAGAEGLELAGITVQDFTDSMMATEIDRMVKVIELAIELFRPDVILTHSQHDQHQDHHAVHLATMRAGRRSPTILCFESPSVTRDFAPNFFIDISGYVDAKIAAVQRHKDQSRKPYMSAKGLHGMAVFRGGQAKTAEAEGFEIMRALSSTIGDL